MEEPQRKKKGDILDDDEMSFALYARNEEFSDIFLSPIVRKGENELFVPAHRVVLAQLPYFRVALSTSMNGDKTRKINNILVLEVKLTSSSLHLLLNYLYDIPNPMRYATFTGSSVIDVFMELSPFRENRLLLALWKIIMEHKDIETIDGKEFLSTLDIALQHNLPFPLPCCVNMDIIDKISKPGILHLLQFENVPTQYNTAREINIRLFWAGSWCIKNDKNATRQDKIEVMKFWFDSWANKNVKESRSSNNRISRIVDQLCDLGYSEIVSSIIIDIAMNIKPPRIFVEKKKKDIEKEGTIIDIHVARKPVKGEKYFCGKKNCNGDHTAEEAELWEQRRQTPVGCAYTEPFMRNPRKYPEEDAYIVPYDNNRNEEEILEENPDKIYPTTRMRVVTNEDVDGLPNVQTTPVRTTIGTRFPISLPIIPVHQQEDNNNDRNIDGEQKEDKK